MTDDAVFLVPGQPPMGKAAFASGFAIVGGVGSVETIASGTGIRERARFDGSTAEVDGERERALLRFDLTTARFEQALETERSTAVGLPGPAKREDTR